MLKICKHVVSRYDFYSQQDAYYTYGDPQHFRYRKGDQKEKQSYKERYHSNLPQIFDKHMLFD
jgi:hypothetical protein